MILDDRYLSEHTRPSVGFMTNDMQEILGFWGGGNEVDYFIIYSGFNCPG